MSTLVTLIVSMILIAWAGLIWLRRADVMADSAPLYAGFWMAIGLTLAVKGIRNLWTGRADPRRLPWLPWLIVGCALLTWVAARWPVLASVFTESSYSTSLTASALAGLIALLAALTVQSRLSRSRWGGLISMAVLVGATSAFVLIGLSIWTHLRIDHSATGRYDELGVDLFVVEHPIFWVVGLMAAFALWWGHD